MKKTFFFIILVIVAILTSFKVKPKKEIFQYTFYRVPKRDLHVTGIHRITCQHFDISNTIISKSREKREISRINDIILNASPIEESDFDTKIKVFITYKNSKEVDSFCISRFGKFSINGKYWQSYDLLNYIYKDDKE